MKLHRAFFQNATYSWSVIALALCLITGGCQRMHVPTTRLEGPFSLTSLEGWSQDDLENFADALRQSCQAKGKGGATNHVPFLRPEGGTAKPLSPEWIKACDAVAPLALTEMKSALEANFAAYRVVSQGEKTGLFTGYYEPLLRGSRVPSSHYTVPLYKKPKDLIVLEDLSDGNGRRRIGRYMGGQLQPYWSRSEIVSGALSGRGEEIAWVDSAIDAFFLQIQGSGIVQWPDGKTERIGYDGTNGHSYVPIGRELVRRGALTPETVSMQSIRAWLAAHPQEAESVMGLNPSYVFFRPVASPHGPIGSQGVPLTPLRSLAVDRRIYPMGSVMWVNTVDPDGLPFRRLMVAQDTGGAIRGPVRGDIFWGHGDGAYDKSGRMKSPGHLYLILPKQ